MIKYANDYLAERSLPDFHVRMNLFNYVVVFVGYCND
jgi:hypothetical protein